MEATIPLAACLFALLGFAAMGWLFARRNRRLHLRRTQADKLLRALRRYSAWVCAQRLATVFHGEAPEAAAALDEACTIRLRWFPELAGDMSALMAVHQRLVEFLGTRQSLWLRDPDHWLESGHDQGFMALWRQHRFALQALLARLEQVTRVRFRSSPTPARQESTYA
jgi:hypothetical protein